MKLRIRGNSVRLRLTQSEVDEFGAGEPVSELVEFGDSEETGFRYELKKSSNEDLDASFENGTLSVKVGESAARQWVNSQDVGIEGTAGKLHILIEKDFECLKPRPGEDESDNFPNPNTGENC
ncbi:MAG: hypothetical protein KIS76_11070 [Pyrinomonadaceae bacterium]|nr:hypothetical protein [Pyrinomonadaceae bacterium]